MAAEEIPADLASSIKEKPVEAVKELMNRLRTQSKDENRKIVFKCIKCYGNTITSRTEEQKCEHCNHAAVDLAVARTQRQVENLKTEAKTKKQFKVLEVPKIENQSAMMPNIPIEIKNILIAKREHDRELAKKRDPKDAAPSETRTQILKDLQGACEAWNKIFSIYIDNSNSHVRTEFLSEIFSVREFVNGKYKILVSAVADLMDTLIDLGEVPEEYFLNYKDYLKRAIEAYDENGIVFANRVVAFASYYVQSPKSTVVTKRVQRAIG